MIDSPVLIIGCARSGTTLLYNVLSEVPALWSIGGESGALIEHHHHPRNDGWRSGALDADDLTPESRAWLLAAFEARAAPGSFWRRVNRLRGALRAFPLWRALKRRGRTAAPGAATGARAGERGLAAIQALVRARNRVFPPGAAPIRLLEKTPENVLRLPFLLALFPDARILYLTRDGRANVSSLMEGWRHPALFHGYAPPTSLSIPGNGMPDRWAFTLIPGWRDLVDAPLEVVCAHQWVASNEAVLAERERGRAPFLTIRYEELTRDPGPTLARVADFLSLDATLLPQQAAALPQINVVSSPGREKWRRLHPDAIQRILPIIAPTVEKLGYHDT